MPKLTSEQKKQIRSLSPAEKESILLKWAGKDRLFFEFLYTNFLNPDFGDEDLFEKYRDELDRLKLKTFPGRSEPARMTRHLRAGLKIVGQFRKTVKKPQLELDLHLHLLDYHFESAGRTLARGYQVYSNVLIRAVGNVIKLVEEKLHEDYHLEYTDKINTYLQTLRRLLPNNPKVRELPRILA